MKHFKLRTLIISLLAIDLITKYIFYDQKILTGFLITPTFNLGVARSLPIPLPLVIIITLGVLIGMYRICVLFDRQSEKVGLDARTIVAAQTSPKGNKELLGQQPYILQSKTENVFEEGCIPTTGESVSTNLPAKVGEVKGLQFSKAGRGNKKIGRIFLGFFLAGTLGNLIDRVWLGGVRDFINIGVFNFPIFNTADIFLNIGIIGLLLQTFILEKRK